MGSTRPERELARARGAYLAAVRRAAGAVTRVIDLDVPMFPFGSGAALPPWSGEQRRGLIELRDAIAHLISARRDYDRMVDADQRRGGM